VPRKKKSAIDSDRIDHDPGDVALLHTIIEQHKDADQRTLEQRKQITLARNFAAGNQIDEADLKKLREVDKPAVSINRTGPVVNAVCGTEEQNRQRMIFLPKHAQDTEASGAADLGNDAYSWVMEQCGGDYERSRAFRDVVVGGIGFTDTRIDIDRDPDGMVVLERVNADNVTWDPYAEMQNLEDANWMSRKRLVHTRDIVATWPKKARLAGLVHMLPHPRTSAEGGAFDHSLSAESSLQIVNLHPNHWKEGAQQIKGRRGGIEPMLPGYHEIYEHQWREKLPYYRVLDPEKQPRDEEGQGAVEDVPLITLTEEEWKNLLERQRMLAVAEGEPYEPPQAIRQMMWCYHRAFIMDGIVLHKEKLPFREFTLKAITYLWDDKNKYWYGIVRDMIDPQKAANKFLAAGIHQVSVAPKGTLIYEKGAFSDANEVAKNWARPGAPIQVEPGTLSNGAPRYKVEPNVPFPEAFAHLVEFSITSLKDVTGVDLGQINATGAQSAEGQKLGQIQTLTILAPLFSAYERYRRSEAKIVMAHVREYIAPTGRLIRIGGPYNAKFQRLLLENLADEYELILDDAPRDPHQKRFLWEVLQPTIPMLLKEGLFPPEFLEFFPGPAVVGAKLRERMEQAQKAQAEAPPQVDKDTDPRYMQAEIELKQAQTAYAYARARSLLAESRVGVAETAQDMVEQERMMETLRGGGRRGLAGAMMKGGGEDEDTLNEAAMLRRARKPKSPGTPTGAFRGMAAA
jgi:hypothetical protein